MLEWKSDNVTKKDELKIGLLSYVPLGWDLVSKWKPTTTVAEVNKSAKLEEFIQFIEEERYKQHFWCHRS
jgi:hypothetical protein